ncbi:MAG: acyl carrier protein [Bacteroidota bacterium]
MNIEVIQSIICELISKELHIEASTISMNASFYELGLDSVNSIFLLAEMEARIGKDIDPMSVYDNPTIKSFASYLHSLANG